MNVAAISMRRAKAGDLPVLVALLADDDLGTAREDASLPLDPGYIAAFRVIDANPDQILAVAEVDGAVVGTLQLGFLPGLSSRGAWHGQIAAVRIAAALRGRGLGERMIRWAVDQCRARGCSNVELMSNSSRRAAHRFYEKLGFVPSHVGMKLKLAQEAALG